MSYCFVNIPMIINEVEMFSNVYETFQFFFFCELSIFFVLTGISKYINNESVEDEVNLKIVSLCPSLCI